MTTDVTKLTATRLHEFDPGFRSFIQLWNENRRPDEQLVDYLLDHELYSQAECVRWCCERPD